MGNFKELRIWKIAKEIAVEVYKLVEDSKTLKRDLRF